MENFGAEWGLVQVLRLERSLQLTSIRLRALKVVKAELKTKFFKKEVKKNIYIYIQVC